MKRRYEALLGLGLATGIGLGAVACVPGSAVKIVPPPFPAPAPCNGHDWTEPCGHHTWSITASIPGEGRVVWYDVCSAHYHDAPSSRYVPSDCTIFLWGEV